MLSQAPRSPWSLGAQTSPPPFSGMEGGSSNPCGFSSRAHSGLVGPTRKWNANPGLFKEREGLEARLGPGQAGCLPARQGASGRRWLLCAHGLIYWRAASDSSFRQRTI